MVMAVVTATTLQHAHHLHLTPVGLPMPAYQLCFYRLNALLGIQATVAKQLKERLQCESLVKETNHFN